MESSNDAYKDMFVREALYKHAEYLIDISQQAIDDLNLIETQNLLYSPAFKIVKSGNDFILQFYFSSYGRAIEIAFHRRKKISSRDVIKQLYGIQSREDVKAQQQIKKRKDTRWYSKNVYGSINNLWGKIAHGFTDDELARLKAIIAGDSSLVTPIKYKPIK